jgi:hypothetical protein
MDDKTHNRLVHATPKRGISATPAERERLCLFILELLEDCPARRTSYEAICPFALEPCSHVNKVVTA